jgi:polyphosphate kinase
VSVVGRFLEHARIFVFHNGGDQEVNLASADWMTRNLDKRIELLFPIEDRACRQGRGRTGCPLRDTSKGRWRTGRLWQIPPLGGICRHSTRRSS